jgi:lysophospholipase L1-like esterase
MIGDSTMAIKPPTAEPERGWGQMLPLFFKSEATISNHAKNGRSTKSFIDEGLWTQVLDNLKRGDWVIIQFGHNDEKSEDPTRFTDPQITYRKNLKKFVTEARAKGANPILCTSIVRRIFKDEILENTHGIYPQMVRRTAKALKVPLLDLESDTRKLVTELGPIKSADLYLFRGEKQDNTHLNQLGGTRIAEMAVARIKMLKLPLVAYLK